MAACRPPRSHEKGVGPDAGSDVMIETKAIATTHAEHGLDLRLTYEFSMARAFAVQ